MSLHRVVVPRVIGIVLALAPVAACVVEREPAPKRPLLRDVMAAQAAASPPRAVTAPGDAGAEGGDPVTLPLDAAPVPESFRTCQVDSDCAAVLRNGCCHDGHNEAINKASIDAYKASFTCPIALPRCPMHLVLDRREPACDAATHACKLVSAPGVP
jgi:hypothetical protein